MGHQLLLLRFDMAKDSSSVSSVSCGSKRLKSRSPASPMPGTM